jgi:hypothetical protein
MPTVEVPVMVLTAQDRCDRCNAQAYVVTQHGTRRLMWCMHHLKVHKDALTPLIVVDERAPEPV